MSDHESDDAPARAGGPIPFKPAPDAPAAGNGSSTRTAPGVCGGCGSRVPVEAFRTDPQRGLMHYLRPKKGEGLNPRLCGPVWTEFTFHFWYRYQIPSIEQAGLDRCFLVMDGPILTRAQVEQAERVIADLLAATLQPVDATGHTIVGARPDVIVRVMSWTSLDRR